MERHQMSRLVIGLGFRDEADAQSIGEVLTAAAAHAAMPGRASAIAVPEDKAAHPGLRAAAHAARLPIEAVADNAMRAADAGVATRSAQVKKHRGVGSVCEAAALAAAGAGARLVVRRIVSADRHATAAAAIIEDFAP
jgi:cobalt-precorrin 5A hydrolase